MHRMERGAYAHATQYGTEGVTRHHSITSTCIPRATRAMVESGVNGNAQFPFIYKRYTNPFDAMSRSKEAIIDRAIVSIDEG